MTPSALTHVPEFVQEFANCARPCVLVVLRLGLKESGGACFAVVRCSAFSPEVTGFVHDAEKVSCIWAGAETVPCSMSGRCESARLRERPP